MEEFAEGTQPQENESVEPGLSRHGWQKMAHLCFEKKHFEERVWPLSTTLTEPCQDPNEGPSLQHPLCPCLQTDFQSSTPQSFRVLLQRRLRLPIPLSSRSCRCGRQLDPFGHHRAGCSEAGVLGDVVSLWKEQQHKCPRHGPASVQPVRQPQAGSGC